MPSGRGLGQGRTAVLPCLVLVGPCRAQQLHNRHMPSGRGNPQGRGAIQLRLVLVGPGTAQQLHDL
eukprot:7868862-Heterocapsa_arctica.AAC.1